MMKAQADGRDIYLALLDWRNTPSEGMGSSPAQRLFGRRTRTLLPSSERLLKPKIVTGVSDKLVARQRRQAKFYNKGAKDLPALSKGDTVMMEPITGHSGWKRAVVTECLGNRSYNIRTASGGVYRRNRRQLRYCPMQVGLQPRSTRSGSSTVNRSVDDDYMFIHIPNTASNQTARPSTPPTTGQLPARTRSPYLFRNRASSALPNTASNQTARPPTPTTGQLRARTRSPYLLRNRAST